MLNVFSSCNNLKKVIVSDIAAWCNITQHGSDANPLTCAHHLYSDENTEITDLVIPNTVTALKTYTFYNCTGLTSITIPNSVTIISSYAFSGCSGLTSITIPNSVTSIGQYAFRGCGGLTSVTIPNSVTAIGEYAFSLCSRLTSVTIPNSVTSIGVSAFSACSGLNSITIPNSVIRIGQYAFQNCDGLTSVIIGKAVSSIGKYAFAKCTELNDVTCMAEEVPKTISDAFTGSFIEYTTLYVPATSLTAYKGVAPWSSFKEIVSIDGNTPETPKCVTPTITYENGKLKFHSETEGAEFKYSITDSDIKETFASEVTLTATYQISVYAMANGYDNSETATATLCWIETAQNPENITTEVIEVPARAILIQTQNGSIIINGTSTGEQIEVYDINGILQGSTTATGRATVIPTTISAGSVAIVKIGQKSVKVVVK